MKSIVWLSLIFLILLGIALPLTYLFFASKLPSLESEFDLENILRGYIEGERRGEHAGQASARSEKVAWPRPDLKRIPNDAWAVFLSEMNCASFFQTPRETDAQASWRVFNAFLFNRALPGNEGGCEFRMASLLANEIRSRRAAPHAIAALRIRNFLTKDQLVAFLLESYQFEDGVFGLEDGSRLLFHKELGALTLPELAELALTLPPNEFYDDIKFCKNPLLVRKGRDGVLERLAENGLVPPDRAKAAMERPLACTNRH